MPAVPIELQIRPDTGKPAQHADDEEIQFVPDLDVYVEHSMCSCNAGDDNPY